MANVKLPKSIEPIKSAQKRSSYQGVFVKADLQRLLDSVDKVASDAAVKVEFAKDAQNLTYFQGDADITVSLVCQRCNSVFEKQISSEFCYSPVQGATDADALPHYYEPIEVDDHGVIDFLQLIEDELILALPVVAMHDDKDCSMTGSEMQFGSIQEADAKPNPFAVLKELKRE